MEKIGIKIGVMVGIFVAFGAFIIYAPRPRNDLKTEKWLEAQAPTLVAGMRMLPSGENPNQSYRMDDRTYEILKPYGIVARVFQSEFGSYDVVLIASQDYQSFHDPRICFTGQGFAIQTDTEVTIKTKSRGEVPASLVKVKGASGDKIALYFFKGPKGFRAKPSQLKFDMLWNRFFGSESPDGVFYRIMPTGIGVTDAQLFDFAANYIDTANSHSKGYF